MEDPHSGSAEKDSGVPGFPRFGALPAVPRAVVLGWMLLLYLVPLGVGLAVGGRPLRLISSGILWDQTEVSLNGFRAILWSPVLCGVLFFLTAARRRTHPFLLALGLVGVTYAATLLTVGGVLGIGPGGMLLVGTELKWVWKTTLAAAGLALGTMGPLWLKTAAEDHEVPVAPIKRQLLVTAALTGALILLLAPGPVLGKVMTGAGSWLGSLVWLVAL